MYFCKTASNLLASAMSTIGLLFDKPKPDFVQNPSAPTDSPLDPEKSRLGKLLFQAVKAAADNRPSKSWRLRVSQIKNNGGDYSVLVQKHAADGTAVGCGMQFDVGDNKLDYFLSFQEHGSINTSEFERFIELATSRVSAIE